MKGEGARDAHPTGREEHAPDRHASPAQAFEILPRVLLQLHQRRPRPSDPRGLVVALGDMAVRAKDLDVAVRIVGTQAPGDDVIGLRVRVHELVAVRASVLLPIGQPHERSLVPGRRPGLAQRRRPRLDRQQHGGEATKVPHEGVMRGTTGALRVRRRRAARGHSNLIQTRQNTLVGFRSGTFPGGGPAPFA